MDSRFEILDSKFEVRASFEGGAGEKGWSSGVGGGVLFVFDPFLFSGQKMIVFHWFYKLFKKNASERVMKE